MHFSTAIVALTAAASTVSAVPLVARQGRPPSNFYLQSRVQTTSPKDLGTSKNDLFVYSLHTGAGAGVAALSANKTDAMQASLVPTNDIYQAEFTFSGNTGSAWPMTMQYDVHAEFSDATIGASNSPDQYGFYFTDNGIMWNNTEFTNWVVCDWQYGSQQLFAQVNGKATLPVSCSKVDLLAVAV